MKIGMMFLHGILNNVLPVYYMIKAVYSPVQKNEARTFLQEMENNGKHSPYTGKDQALYNYNYICML